MGYYVPLDIIYMENALSFFQNVHIFSSLTDIEIKTVVKSLKLSSTKKGDILCRQGDEGKILYIVKEGKAAGAIKLAGGEQKEIVEFNPGDFFGEMSIIENVPRSATCYVKESGSLYKLHKKDFFKIIESNPQIAIKIMYKMLNITTQRLRKTGGLVSDMVRWGDAASKRAITDELTGAYNRRFLENSLEDFLIDAKTGGKPFSLIMADLDYFREINEAYGHETGDRVIMEAAAVFKSKLNEKDILARYGGDEFTILLPETSIDEAKAIAESIRQQMEKLDILKDYDGPVTGFSTSQGVSSYPETAKDLESLKKQADKALYAAKEAGRNRVMCAK